MLKRFYLMFAVFCVSLVLIFSCSTGELDPFDPDYDPDDETELDDPDKKDKEDDEPVQSDIIPTELIVAKQRNGPIGIVKLLLESKFARFTPLAKEGTNFQ